MGLYVGKKPPYWIDLAMSRFLRDIQSFLPDAEAGEEWVTRTVR